MGNTFEEVDDIHFDVLQEIGNIGAGNATTALSNMLQEKSVGMQVPKVQMYSFKELSELVGGAETLAVGIMLSLEGDINGSLMFILEIEAAWHLVNLVLGTDKKRNAEETGFSEMERSALVEVGNIITGAYLSSIATLTNLSVIPSIPYMAIDMAGAILSVPAIEFGKLGDKALLIESQFTEDGDAIKGYFILIPTLESYNHMMTSLGL